MYNFLGSIKFNLMPIGEAAHIQEFLKAAESFWTLTYRKHTSSFLQVLLGCPKVVAVRWLRYNFSWRIHCVLKRHYLENFGLLSL